MGAKKNLRAQEVLQMFLFERVLGKYSVQGFIMHLKYIQRLKLKASELPVKFPVKLRSCWMRLIFVLRNAY